MQSEVPALPVVFTDGKKRSARNTEDKDESSSVKVKNHNTCKFSSKLVSNRRQLDPLVGGPYRSSMRLYALSEPIRSTNKTTVGQRVMSAKMLRVKQLQNQLADAHYHLNELANENRLLKALQKRQDSALRKYEGTNAELPRIINSHHEELKVLQTRYKKLRMQHKQTCDSLKEKENEIYALQTQNKHLVQLSKDRHLEERDKLQMRVSDLNFRIQQQQETIQTLNRKLALESKSLKHQLNSEVAKHKETQKHLHEALEKLKTLEDLLDNREKRLYYSGRLPICNKGKATGSQSLMNLGQNGVASNPLKAGSKSRGTQNESENGNLPKLTRPESSEEKMISRVKEDRIDERPLTETMSSLKQVRKFRLRNSYSRGGSAGMLSALDKSDEEETTRNATDGSARYSQIEKLGAKIATTNEADSDDDEIKRLVENFELANGKEIYELPKQLLEEFGYSSSESDTADDGVADKFGGDSLAHKSRDLHTRLIADEAALPSFPNADSEKVDSSSQSEGGSESDEDRKNSQKSMDKMENDKDVIEPSVNDSSKLDVNSPELDFESKRLGKTRSEPSGISRVSNDLSSKEYEDTQRELLSITKSWTEVQARIKREREIAESQLKALEEETPGEQFSRKTFNGTWGKDDSSRDKRSPTSGETESSVIQEPETSEKAFSNETEYPKDGRKSPEDGERSKTMKNADDSTGKTNRNDETLEQKRGSDAGNHATNMADVKLINYNKQKLLAAMKAIDDNENIDFSSGQKYRTQNSAVRSQINVTENLYRGLPTHARKKDDLLKELFGDGKVETKLRSGCSKLH